ncbi:hypothetical protein HPP92_026556 [Vanilla planifolia]|uniref:Pentatricopeptide repeat-containing protein n=1 Tax=Vanilla planifolia TaxID=51239 RepID=A0A835PI89_VANPL|nr:hypothetical protein HPP92_026556 [Vanilla planifolia]
MIGRYCDAGMRKEGLKLFSRMMQMGVLPNDFTYACVLDACSELAAEGLGRQVYNHMIRVGFDPHLCCQAGRFQEVEEIINEMTMKPDKFLWASLLGGCRYTRILTWQNRQQKLLLEIEPENAATYVTFANIYALLIKMKELGYVPDMNYVLHDVDEEQRSIRFHTTVRS